MEESAQEIIQTPEQTARKLHQGVKAQLTTIGHNVDVVPESEKPPPFTEELKQVGGDVIHSAGSAFEEFVGGTNTTHVRTAKGKVSTAIALKRRLLRQAA